MRPALFFWAFPVTTIYLVEIVGHDGTTTQTLRYSSGSGYNHPSAPGYYEPRLVQPANFRRSIFGSGRTGGSSTVGFGELVLANADAGLDSILSWGFDGRSVTLLIGDDAADYSTFITVLRGTAEQAVFDWDRVTFRLRDRQELFDKPLQPVKYAGTNVLPVGLEGTADDLKGQPKPILFGRVQNIAPPVVNTSRLIYQLHDGAGVTVQAVYDQGASLTAGAVYASAADLQATAPAAGQYRVYSGPEGTFIRLGSSPVGQVTVDATATQTTAAQIANLIVIRAGLSAGEIASADIAALDAAQPAQVGLWCPDEITVREALDQVAQSVGAWWGFDRVGTFRIVRFEAPSGSPVVTLRDFSRSVVTAQDGDILGLERQATNDQGRGVPAYRVKLSYSRNWSLQDTDLAGVVTDARRAFLAEEFREVVAEESAVQAKHLLAEELTFESLIHDATAAQAEANRLLALYKVFRELLTVTVKFGQDVAGLIDLGSVVKLEIPRFGYDTGKLFRVISLEYDAQNYTVELGLWG